MNVDLHQLEDNLNKLPAQIRDAQLAHIEAKEVSEKAKITLKVASAMALIFATGSNATEKSAKAVIKTQKEQEASIEAQMAEAKKEAELTYLINRFVALRKITSLETEAMKSQVSGF